ncbi:MAG: HNH endonuclease [Nanoarchaeota archaeon]|nr:HNH endonuclease [Nanoarchaeota archaeon]
MPNCDKCKKKIGLTQYSVLGGGLCKTCKIKEDKKSGRKAEPLIKCKTCKKKIGAMRYSMYSGLCPVCFDKQEHKNKAEDIFIKNCGEDFGDDNTLFRKWNDDEYAIFGSGSLFSKEEIVGMINKHKLDINKAVAELNKIGEKRAEENCIEHEAIKIRKRAERLRIRQEAEKRVFGKTNIKSRTAFSKNDKSAIFEKFHNECAICGASEGLHIHHKDKDPSNSNINNLIVLCGVCHKKVHMKVR